MIFIRRNPAFYDQLHPCGGIDAATVQKAAAACHAAAGANDMNNANSRCFPSPTVFCAGRASPRSCSSRGAPAQKQEQITTKNDCFDSDSKVIMENTPVHRNETSEKTVISLDVAGFEPEHLKVEIEDHVLMVSAKRTNKLGDTFGTRRRFALKADVYDEDSVHADLEDGVLQITIQKKVATASRHIPITVTLSSSSKKSSITPAASADAAMTRNDDEEITSNTSNTSSLDRDSTNAEQAKYSSATEEEKTSQTTSAVGQAEEHQDSVSEETVSVETVNEHDEEEEVVEEKDVLDAKHTWEEVVQA